MSDFELSNENAATAVGLIDYDWQELHPAFIVKADKPRLLKLIRNCDTCKVWVHSLAGEVIVQKGSIQAAVQAAPADAEYAVMFNGVDLLIGGRIYPPPPDFVAETCDGSLGGSGENILSDETDAEQGNVVLPDYP
jgi:hypothetical protein